MLTTNRREIPFNMCHTFKLHLTKVRNTERSMSKYFLKRCTFTVFTVLILQTTNVLAAAITSCEPKSTIALTFDILNNSTNVEETSNGLPNIALTLDYGFLKLSGQDNDASALYRQIALRENGQDPLDITLRYEVANAANIEKSSIIISDPMCRNYARSRANIMDITDKSYASSIYECECLSANHHSANFIKSE